MSQQESFGVLLGLESEVTAPGRARVWVRVGPQHLNILGIAHGGFLYSLADTAFSLAVNSRGKAAVALSTHMEYMEAVRVGEPLEAVAREVRLGGRTAVYQVEVRSGERLVAQFTGTAYRSALPKDAPPTEP